MVTKKPDRHRSCTDYVGRASAHPVEEGTAALVADEQREDRRQQSEPRLDGAKAAVVLEPEREVHEDADHGVPSDEHDDVVERESGIAEEAQVEQRVRVAELAADEPKQREESSGQEPDGRRRTPAPSAPLLEADRHAPEPQCEERSADAVRGVRLRSGGLGGVRLERQGDGAQRHGHVDEEHPAPRGELGEESTDERTGDEHAEGDVVVDGHRSATLRWCKRCHHERERGGLHERGPGTLRRARRDQRLRRGRQTGQGRSEDEDADACDERPQVTDPVAEIAPHDDECAKRDDVRRHHPLLHRRVGMQIAPDRGKGDADDRLVEEDHRDRPGHRNEHPARAVPLAHAATIG
jgi:hypothetical protein